MNKNIPSLCLLAMLAGCAAQPPRPPAHVLPSPPPVKPVPLSVAPVPPPDEVSPLLAYHQSLRRMTQGELLKELSGLTLQQRTPKLMLQSGMILMLTHGNGDLARAQALFDTVATAGEPEAQGLKSFAQLLSTHCAEARRLADHAEKLQAQLKENQRKTDQLNETLEALKAIERGLPVRPQTGSTPGGK
ncbi:hypothetical protein [Massilia endophytica]|uniref:hypothetical protein n=1 Tax=Massilia endophytica TaxID=2899220 RepID=UPI001E54C876|nr:hypothetical protein [Massilia endophytica]UGQ44994.1 hypothetical protein LSQ66_14430 [Massilia endophytica]